MASSHWFFPGCWRQPTPVRPCRKARRSDGARSASFEPRQEQPGLVAGVTDAKLLGTAGPVDDDCPQLRPVVVTHRVTRTLGTLRPGDMTADVMSVPGRDLV